MLKFLKTLTGMGTEAAREADNTLTKRLVAANPRLALEAELNKRKDQAEDWTSRVVAAKRALVEDERETAAAQKEFDEREQNLERLRSSLEGADEKRKARIMQLASVEAEKFSKAKVTLERELSEDGIKRSTLEKIELGHKAATVAVEKLESQIGSAIAKLEAAQATTDTAKMQAALDAELADLSDPLAETNVALAALNEAVGDAEDELAVLELSGKTSTASNHDDSVEAFLAGDDAKEPNDPFAVLK